jgi:hypothetical protein
MPTIGKTNIIHQEWSGVSVKDTAANFQIKSSWASKWVTVNLFSM